MKHTLWLGLGILVLTVGVNVGADGAAWVSMTADQPDEVAVLSEYSEASQYQFIVTVPGLSVQAVSEEGQEFTMVNLPAAGRIGATGEPMLPAFRRFLEIPQGAEAQVTALALQRQTVNLAELGLPSRLYPVQLPRPKCDCAEARNWRFSFSEEAYRGEVGHDLVALRGPFGIRDHRVVMLTLSPVTYYPDRGELEVVTRVQVTVRFKGGDISRTEGIKDRLASRHFDDFLTGHALNLNLDSAKAAGWSYPDDGPVEFLIVTPPQFETALQPFVDWKTSCGFNVTVATTSVTGTTTTSIKSYITGLYNGPNPPVYVLMIGDSPSPLVTFEVASGGNGGTDLPYVQMDADMYPDMMIARWPVDDETELINMRDKILFYENPTAANSAWLNRALFLGGDDYASHGQTTHQTVMASFMEPAPNSADCEYWDGEATNYTTQQLISDLNTGRGWAVYSAHSGPTGWAGDPPLSSSDIANLANSNMYPIGHGHSCESNMWNDYADVFGEVTVTQANRGFVSYWGGSNSTYWDEDDWLERGFFDSLFDIDLAGTSHSFNRQYSNIAACYSGLTEVTLSGGDEQYYWYLYNLNGDPTLDPFTKQPDGMTVSAPASVPPAAGSFTVSVDDGAGAVAAALVGVTQDGNLLGAGYTDASGQATFAITAPSAGSALLVRVTAHNHLPTDASTSVGSACVNNPSAVDVTPNGPITQCEGSAQVLIANVTGGSVLAFQWTRNGSAISGATSASYSANDTGTHEYNCVVTGAGCSSGMSDGTDTEVTWTSEPEFAGAQSASRMTGECGIRIDWDAATPICSTGLSYSLYRSTDSDFTPASGNRIVSCVGDEYYEDTAGLSSGSTYYYVVRAEDGASGGGGACNGGNEDSNLVAVSQTVGGGTETLLDDDFETAGDWSTWTVTTGPGPHTCGDWARSNSATQRPPNSAGYYALTDSDACGSGSQTSTVLTSKVLDAGGAISLTLDYDIYYRHYTGDDSTVEVYDGASWVTIWSDSDANEQEHRSWNLTAYANSDFQVRFSYQNASYDWWFAVDNVVVTAELPVSCP